MLLTCWSNFACSIFYHSDSFDYGCLTLNRSFFSPLDEPDASDEGYPVSEYLRRRRAQLGRNARMLANQPPDRLVDGGKVRAAS